MKISRFFSEWYRREMFIRKHTGRLLFYVQIIMVGFIFAVIDTKLINLNDYLMMMTGLVFFWVIRCILFYNQIHNQEKLKGGKNKNGA